MNHKPALSLGNRHSGRKTSSRHTLSLGKAGNQYSTQAKPSPESKDYNFHHKHQADVFLKAAEN